jgi:mRNA interferase YafQ
VAKRKSNQTSTPEPPQPPPPLVAKPTTKFQQDVERQKRRGKDMAKLRAIIESLCHHRPLDARHRDHGLKGNWKGWRDCHVEPDWVLIYKQKAGDLILARTGSRDDLGLE